MKCIDLGEFALIERLAKKIPRHPSVVTGIGDDAAVLRTRVDDRYLLFTTDPVVEGTHFALGAAGKKEPPPATPRQIGWKAMGRNLSDIAAMGGVPKWAVVSLGLPANTPVALVDGIYRGLARLAARFDTVIVGGDVAETKGPLFVSVALVGEVEKKCLKLRSTACPGQMVFVTGALGGSRRGKHLRFMPRVDEARWLVQHFPVQAMIDVSDGLGGDLQRIAEASGVGFDIKADAVPVSGAARMLARRGRRKTALEHAWGDGEDFELLFTLPVKHCDALLRRWHASFRLRLSPIGVVTASKKRIRLLDRTGVEMPVRARGFEHFGARS